eukprot:GHVR01016789.1.p1 GENE.GHVR01016789.1~~GHVR01016789.1.p1  ORF type:complete len:191 (+),score=45.94 GHVR01016789.1:146-718(+)
MEAPPAIREGRAPAPASNPATATDVGRLVQHLNELKRRRCSSPLDLLGGAAQAIVDVALTRSPGPPIGDAAVTWLGAYERREEERRQVERRQDQERRQVERRQDQERRRQDNRRRQEERRQDHNERRITHREMLLRLQQFGEQLEIVRGNVEGIHGFMGELFVRPPAVLPPRPEPQNQNEMRNNRQRNRD